MTEGTAMDSVCLPEDWPVLQARCHHMKHFTLSVCSVYASSLRIAVLTFWPSVHLDPVEPC